MLSVGCQIYWMREKIMYCLNVSLCHILTTVQLFGISAKYPVFRKYPEAGIALYYKRLFIHVYRITKYGLQPLLYVHRIKLIMIEIFKIIHKIGLNYLHELFVWKVHIHYVETYLYKSKYKYNNTYINLNIKCSIPPHIDTYIHIPIHVSGLLINLWGPVNLLFVCDKYVTPTGKCVCVTDLK